TLSEAPAQAKKGGLRPVVANAKYGPHKRNVLDLWPAKSDAPTPLVIYIHGGGFRAGDKSSVSPLLLRLCLEQGISVAAINYRLSQHAPFPAPMEDGARAVQFLRSKAKEWNLDPEKFAATGGSAGAGISLWIAFRDDMAKPDSDDPVERQSTRLTCAAVVGAQSSYDPRWIRKVVGGRAHEHPALTPFYGLKPDELDSPKAHKLYEEASPINFVSEGDPPVFLFYSEPKGPLPKNAKPGQGIHHPNFGVELKKAMDALGIECVLRHREDYKGNAAIEMHKEMVAFFRKHLGGMPGDSPGGQKPGDKPKKPAPPAAKGPSVSALLRSADAAEGTVTVTLLKEDAGAERTFELDKDLHVLLDRKGAKLGDLKPGVRVTLRLTEDRKSVHAISAEGPTLRGNLETIDADRGRVLIAVKTKEGTEEQLLELSKDVQVAVAGKKNATLADVQPGEPAHVTLSADELKVIALRVGKEEDKVKPQK
ncbi:MAG TPA: alpha/beta hydrolase, partial [Gemmataceae bacterium]